MVPSRARGRRPGWCVLARVALAGGVLAAAAACDEPQPRGRVQGVVREGAACGSDSGQVCLPRAVAGEVQLVGDGEVRARARTEPSGHYEVTVGAGDYTVVVDVGGPAPLCPQLPVQVRSAATVIVDIDCQGGA